MKPLVNQAATFPSSDGLLYLSRLHTGCVCRSPENLGYFPGVLAGIRQMAAKNRPETGPSKAYQHTIETCCYVPCLRIALHGIQIQGVVLSAL